MFYILVKINCIYSLSSSCILNTSYSSFRQNVPRFINVPTVVTRMRQARYGIHIPTIGIHIPTIGMSAV